MTVVRAKQRSYAGQLADYLTRDPTAELGQVRGVVATSAHQAIAELTLLAAGTRCTAELFHCSVNPNPADPAWTPEQYRRGWAVFEREHGLTDHAFVEVFHTDEGRLHAHRVYAVVADGRAAKLSWTRIVNEKIARVIEHEFGHRFLPGPNQATALKWLERSRDPVQRGAAAAMRAAGLTEGPKKPPSEQAWEKDQSERTAVAVAEIERAAAEAWRAAGGDGANFMAKLKACNLYLARGDKGPVIVDWAEGVHPAGRRLFAGLTKGEPSREKRHQAQGDAIAAACPVLPSVDQARAKARQAMAPEPEAELSPPPAALRPAREIDRLIFSAWQSTSTGEAFVAQLDGAGLVLCDGDKARHWQVIDIGNPDGRPHDLVRSVLAASKAESIKRKTADVRPEIERRLAGLALPTVDSMRQHGGEDDKERAAESRAERKATIQKSNPRQNRRKPPPRARHRLHDLSELELVSFGQSSKVLLQGDVRNNVFDDESTRDTDVRQELRLGDHEMNAQTATADQAVRASHLRELADRAQQRGDDEKAIALYRESAELGDVDAQDTITAREDEGIIIVAETIAELAKVSDPLTRFMVMDKEAARIDTPAEDQVEAEVHRLAAAKEIMASSRLRERAADMGFAERVYSLAPCVENRTADEARERGFDFKAALDHEYAIQSFREAAAAGDAESLFELGLYHEFGVGVHQDLTEAVRLYQAAAGAGLLEANSALKDLSRRQGLGQAQEPQQAAEPSAKPRESKEAWQSRRAAEELGKLPADRLADIATGKDQGKDRRLWAWRWNNITADAKRALEEKVAAARQDEGRQRRQPVVQAQTQDLGALGPRDAAQMSAADRAAAYRAVVGAKSRINIQDDVVRVTLPSGQTIRDDGRNILVDRVEGATYTHTAAIMMGMVKARGWAEVQLRGPRDFKLALARAAGELGIEVKNADLAADVARFKKEQENTARMRPTAQSQENRRPDQAADRRVAQQPKAEQVVPTDTHQVIEQYAGRALDRALTRGAEAATSTLVGGLDIQLAGGASLTHSDELGAELAGLLTTDRAQLMAELMVARGETSVSLSGSQHAKELMARAAVSAGLEVFNAELSQFVEKLKREQAQSRERQAQVAAMRPDRQGQTERLVQSREASAGALKELEIGRLKNEMTAAGNPIDRMRAADRLARATSDMALRNQAEEVRLQAAHQVVAESHHDEMAEEIVEAASHHQSQSSTQGHEQEQ